jgi:sigma-E factor negative regulatory protein RseC
MTQTCQEAGVVTETLPEGKVMVRIRRAEACGSCEAKGACAAFGGNTEDITLIVENTLDAEIGDEVVLELSEGAVIKASAAVYLVPAVNLILGGLVGVGVSEFLHTDKDAATLLGAALGLLLGLFISGRIGGKMASNPQFVPTLTAIRSRASTVH